VRADFAGAELLFMAISNPSFQFVQELVASRSGVALPGKDKYLVEARLLPLARQQKMSSVEDLIIRVQSENTNGLPHLLLDALLPKETSFFRDLHPFELLKNQILRTLEMKRSREQKLIIWCAGCSAGQEAYSVAMILHRYYSHLLRWNLEIYATDLSRGALEKAKEGRYDEVEVQRGIPPVMVKEYFRQAGPFFFVKEEIRQLVQFDEFNLAGDWPELTKVDVILLRNVLRYMNSGVKGAILQKLAGNLETDGYLFLGAEESPADISSAFTLVPSEKAVYYQRSGSAS
jgi:chemotaxis protein methyltransferase CheR